MTTQRHNFFDVLAKGSAEKRVAKASAAYVNAQARAALTTQSFPFAPEFFKGFGGQVRRFAQQHATPAGWRENLAWQRGRPPEDMITSPFQPVNEAQAFGQGAASILSFGENQSSYDINAVLSEGTPFEKAMAATGAFLPGGEHLGPLPNVTALRGMAKQGVREAAPTVRQLARSEVGALGPRPAEGSLGDIDAQMAKLRQAMTQAKSVGADVSALQDAHDAMSATRMNIIENNLGPEKFARYQEVRDQLSQALDEVAAWRLRENGAVRPPPFGSQERAVYDNARRIANEQGHPPKTKAQFVAQARKKVTAIKAEHDALLKDAYAGEMVTGTGPTEVAPRTSVQTGLPGMGPQTAQGRMMPEFQATAQESIPLVDREALLAKEANRPLPGQAGMNLTESKPRPEPAQAGTKSIMTPLEWAKGAIATHYLGQESQAVTTPRLKPADYGRAMKLLRDAAKNGDQDAATLVKTVTSPVGVSAQESIRIHARQQGVVPPTHEPVIPKASAVKVATTEVKPPITQGGEPSFEMGGIQRPAEFPEAQAAAGGQPPVPPSGGVPPGKPPVPPPATPPIPPSAVGRTYVGDLRSFEADVADVVTSDNPVVSWVAGKTGINPSLLAEGEVGKAVVAYHRQGLEADQLIESALSALDAQARRVTGVQRGIPITSDGFLGKTGKLWNDVFSEPGKYALSKETLAYVKSYRAIIDEAEALRVSEGLKPIVRTGPAGWFYVPRQVKGIRGVELRRPSSAKLNRVYEEATDGFARGVRYDADPRATLEAHLRATYREIIEKRMSDALEPFSLAPKELVPFHIRTGLEQAIKDLRQTERAGRAAIIQARKNLARPAATPRQVALRQRDLAALNRTVDDVSRKNAAVRATYDLAKMRYRKAMEAARKAETAEGTLFGQDPGTIAIGQWHNRFFPRAQADQLKNALETRFGGTGPFGKLVNTVRSGASVMDVSVPFIQGLPVLGRNPVAWARATKDLYWTLLDPAARARYMNANRPLMQEMAQNGIPLQETEFFAGTREGQGLALGAPIGAIPKVGGPLRSSLRQVGKQTYGRFQESYSAFLLTARAELYKGLKGHMSAADAATLTRNLTGGLESRALGVGPSQRAAEGMWIAFSPKYLRSTGALFQDATKLGTPRGRQAALSLAGTAGAVTAIYVAVGVALGKSEDEIAQGFNPLGGKRFLSYNVNGDWIGVGSQVYGISRFLAELASLPLPGGKPAGDILATNRYDNPVVSFAMSRAAPGMNIVMTLGEAVTGRDLVKAEVTSIPDILLAIGTSTLPFVAQAKLEGQQTATLIASETGARTSPENVYEQTRHDFSLIPGVKDLGLQLGRVGDSIDLTPGTKGGSFQLTPAQRAQYQQIMADTVIPALTSFAAKPAIKALPDDRRKEVLQTYMGKLKDQARAKAVRDIVVPARQAVPTSTPTATPSNGDERLQKLRALRQQHLQAVPTSTPTATPSNGDERLQKLRALRQQNLQAVGAR